MTELNTKNVQRITFDCLVDGVSKDNRPMAERIKEVEEKGGVCFFGVNMRIYFDTKKVAMFREDIIDMLKQLPNEFMTDLGASFVNMAWRQDGVQWANLQRDMDALVCLGLAIGKVEFKTRREYWWCFPGGVPFIVVKHLGF